MLIQSALRQPYRRETWTTLLRDLFPDGSVTLLATPSEIDAPHDSVTATRQLGQLQLADGSRVALVEVEAADVQNRSLKKQAKYRSEKPGPEDHRREDLEKLSKGFEVKYLLAVMNSSVARGWLRARRRSNIHLYPDDWKPLPIPVVDSSVQTPIVKLVDQILTARKANPNADISDLETAIDQKVKQAYGLV